MRTRRHHLPEACHGTQPRVVSITVRTAGHRDVFREARRASEVVTAVTHLHSERWQVLCYCIMPDHVHVMLLNRSGSPGRFVQALKAVATRALRRLGTEGEIWQRNYYDHVIRKSDGIATALRYVLTNPIRRGLVETWTDWPFAGSPQWPDLDRALGDPDFEKTAWDLVFTEKTTPGL